MNLPATAGSEDHEAGQGEEAHVPPSVIVLVVIVPAVVAVQFFAQRNMLTRYDYQCGRCGATFSPTALSLTLAPHRIGGSKYMRCPQCGMRSWVTPVPKG
jgi:DNA-directed RNA polymerase subunit RPC12/RpoP